MEPGDVWQQERELTELAEYLVEAEGFESVNQVLQLLGEEHADSQS